jgi:hypothetical protein
MWMLPPALPEAMVWLSWQAATLVMRPVCEERRWQKGGHG